MLATYVDASVELSAASRRRTAHQTAGSAAEVHSRLIELEEELAAMVIERLDQPAAETTPLASGRK